MQRENEVQHVFLVGAKSLGAYGGYETFVYKLTEYHQNKKNIKYHVACKANGDGCMDETKVDGATRINDHEFEFHNAHCFKIDIPQIGPAQAIYYDVAALKACCKYIKEHRIKHPIVYIMACRIGPFAGHFYKEIHKLGGTVYLNPDGHEWMRAKWSAPIRKYWKISEQMMVKYCDLAICDSVNIEKYIHECYDGKGIKGRNPKTTFIAYGADLTLSKLEKIVFTGFKHGKELRELISHSTCIVCPAIWYENMPNTVIEAYAYGKPVVASRIGSLAEIVEDNKTGLLFEMKNSKDFSDKLRKFIDEPTLSMTLGINARCKVEKDYAVEKHMNSVVRILEGK